MSGYPYEGLRFANRVRNNIGLKPLPKLRAAGKGQNPIEATIIAGNKRVKSASVGTFNTTVKTTTDTLLLETPLGAGDFVSRFNEGLHPEYAA